MLREWVLKVSRLCNLRCRYCYEWDGLADPRRMDLALWPRIFAAVRTLAERDERESGAPGTNRLIWHGGEPTLLPLDYFERVMALQRAAFPADWLAGGRIRNIIQTNLFALPDAKLDFLVAHGFEFGVSCDIVDDVRVDAGNRPTAPRVLENLARLDARGLDPGQIVVIAGHTAPAIADIYAHLPRRGRSCSLLPLFDGPDGRPAGAWAVGRDEVNAALFRFFELWFADGCPFRVRPLDQYLTTVVMHLLGLRRQAYDRRRGERILVVGVNGELHEPSTESLSGTVLGNLATQSIDEIVASAPYAASLADDDRVRDAVCGACEWLGACSTGDMFMVDDGGRAALRCMTAQPLHTMIAAHLRDAGIGRAELAGLLAVENAAAAASV